MHIWNLEKYCILMHIWNLEKWYQWTYLQGRNKDADVENKLVNTEGEGESGREQHWHIYTATCETESRSFPGGSAGKNLLADAGDSGFIPDPGRPHLLLSTRPERHNYWACVLEPGSHSYRGHMLQLKLAYPRAHAPQQERSPQWEGHALQLESNSHHGYRKAHAAVRPKHSQKYIQ